MSFFGDQAPVAQPYQTGNGQDAENAFVIIESLSYTSGGDEMEQTAESKLNAFQESSKSHLREITYASPLQV